MGAVYRATDHILGRNVAIKILKDSGGEEVGKRIRLEAQILARLLHDNIVRLYDFGESEGVYYLVMEEVDGSSFSKRWRLLPLAERLRIASQTAEALNYAHHQGVIHRDVKPANVLLTAGDQAKLSDFGLSMLVEEKDESGVIRGTPHYMSPEQARGKRLDHRTDLYSLGIVLYECATGTTPFLGQSMAVLAQHINAPVHPPRVKNPEISTGLEALIMRLLAKSPEDRPASGEEVARILRDEAEFERNRRPGAGEGIAIPSFEPVTAATVARALIDTGSSEILPDTRVTKPPVAAPKPASVPAVLPSRTAAKVSSPLAAEMLHSVLDAPMILSPDERYLCGHYLAYLLGAARRQGIFLRRPLDPRNADRARLMLAMTWLMSAGPGEENVAKAAKLLDTRPEIRPALNPIVVMKYLACRDTPTKRKRFRVARKQLQDASSHAMKAMLDPNGILNPGLMPQNFEDLHKIAPARSEVDDLLVTRWNRVAEVWRTDFDFRQSVLRYATSRASKDPASIDLWPEVVYPLIERARWQRAFRPRHEALFDYVSAKVLRLPDAGVRMDRMIVKAVPVQVAEELVAEFAGFVEDPLLEDDEQVAVDPDDARLASVANFKNLDIEPEARAKGIVALVPPEPYRISQGDLRQLWSEAMAVLGKPGGAKPRAIPIGPYRLAVIPSVRGRSAGQVALQGMPNKQIELLTPSIRAGGSSSKPVVAVWVYQDGSVAIAHLDFKGNDKYIFWHAPNAQQFNYEDGGELNHMLYTLGMELPEQLDRVLTKKYRPPSPA